MQQAFGSITTKVAAFVSVVKQNLAPSVSKRLFEWWIISNICSFRQPFPNHRPAQSTNVHACHAFVQCQTPRILPLHGRCECLFNTTEQPRICTTLRRHRSVCAANRRTKRMAAVSTTKWWRSVAAWIVVKLSRKWNWRTEFPVYIEAWRCSVLSTWLDPSSPDRWRSTFVAHHIGQ